MADPNGSRDGILARFRTHYAERDYLKALQDCRDLLDLDPRDPKGWRNMGAAYIALGQDKDALEVSKRAAEIDPKDPYVYYNLGVLSARNNEHDSAILYFQKAIELAPEMAEAQLGMASSSYQLGDYSNAVYYYSQAYQMAPQNAEIARSFGATLMKIGQLSKATYYLRHAIELAPDWAEPHLELGETLRQLGEDRDAVAELLKGLRLRQRPDGLVSLSRVHLKYHEPRKALSHLQRALELSPDHAPAHHVLGLCYAALKAWPNAIRHLENAHRLDPNGLDAALDLASALVESGHDLNRAHLVASAVRLKDPNQIRALDVVGWCLHKQGKNKEAHEELEKARALLELQDTVPPAFAAVYEHLAAVYTAIDDSMMAREMYARALEADPTRRQEWQRRQQELGAPSPGSATTP